MSFLEKIFNRTKKQPYNCYTDEELIAMGYNLRNKVLILHMDSPYNKVIVSNVKNVIQINGCKYVELIGYNLNRQSLSIIVSIKTFIKLCRSSVFVFESSCEDEIYLKEIKDIDNKGKDRE